MTTVLEIEEAIQQLPPLELTKLRQWFAEFDAARWDRQIEDDIAAGRLEKFAVEARRIPPANNPPSNDGIRA